MTVVISRELKMVTKKCNMGVERHMAMVNVHETLDMLQTVQAVVSSRLERLRKEGAEEDRIEREEWRRKLLEETIKAVAETAETVQQN